MLVNDVNLAIHVLVDVLHTRVHQRLVAAVLLVLSILSSETLVQELLRIFAFFFSFRLLLLLLFAAQVFEITFVQFGHFTA